ncbi:hypothetical protein FRC0549_00086 [Corynebacterium diphtheriae]|nr:hypothetical protein FRC0549_00086 [Corynebacterium diphtheriae]
MGTTTPSAPAEDTTGTTATQAEDTTGTTATPSAPAEDTTTGPDMGTPLGTTDTPQAEDTTTATPSAPLPAAPVLTVVDGTAEDEDAEDVAITVLMQDYDPADTITPRRGGCRVYDPEDTERAGDGSVSLTTAQAATVLEIITAAQDYLGTGDTATAALYGAATPIPPRLVHTVAKAVAAGEAAPSDRETFPDGPPNDLALINRIMNFSPTTRAIYTHSTGTGGMGHPVAAYVHQLVLTCMRIPPYLRTPTGDGEDKKPISLYVQLMGASGAGKSITMARPWLWARTGETRHWFNERAEDNDTSLMQDAYLAAVAPDLYAERERDFIRASRPGEEDAHLNRTTPAQRHTMGTYRGIKPVIYDPTHRHHQTSAGISKRTATLRFPIH